MVMVIAALFILVVALVYRFYAQYALINELSHKTARSRVFIHFSEYRFLAKYGIAGLACIALAYALSRPQTMQERQAFAKTRDVYIILDVSASMLAQDCKPDRLTFAKEKIKKLVSQLKSERVSLIIFASDACNICPLTHDVPTFFTLLENIDSSTISHSSTNSCAALRLVAQRQMESQKSSKLVLLLTDGEDFSELSKDQTAVCKELIDQNIVLSCMTIGTNEGAPIPDGKGDFIRDESGKHVISKRIDTCAKKLAHNCSGIHIVADKEHDRDIEMLIKEIEKIERNQQLQAKTEHSEWYMYPAAVAFVALLIEWFL